MKKEQIQKKENLPRKASENMFQTAGVSLSHNNRVKLICTFF